MNDDKINQLLKRYGETRRSAPAVPGQFNSQVWRRIRALKQQQSEWTAYSWLEGLLAPFLSYRFVCASVLIGAFTGITGSLLSSQLAPPHRGGTALSLEVFNPRTMDLKVLGGI
ncbi:MAG: hypothetical protein ACAI35_24130 [Candidatus Methylacidiphilales bacterium]|nr:hypothetical protein [Candidatus Methylacidiphilales bacterium]